MTAYATALLDPDSLSRQQLQDECWRQGKLRWLMHASQAQAYDKYRAWELTRLNDERDPVAGSFPRIFTLPISKRWGKTSMCLWILAEDAIRNPGTVRRYASAFQANIAEIVNDVSREVFASAPPDVCPVYKGSQGPQGAGFYFPNGSVIRLVGVDLHPNGLRGQSSDGDAFSECGFMTNLLYVVKNVIYHQYQGRPHASLILESSAPNAIDTEWERIFLPDAKARGAYFEATILDNPRLSDREKREAIAAAGGRGHPDCEREFFNVIAVDPGSRVVPEFDESRHVQDWPQPRNAHCYTSADPGTRDLFGLLWGYWDFGRAALYIQQDWAEPNALTRDVAAVIRRTEQALWGAVDPAGDAQDRFALREARRPVAGASDVELVDRWHPQTGAPPGTLTWYDGRFLRANPYQRVSDIDLRLCADLGAQYGLQFQAIRKDSLEAMLASFRDALSNGKIIIHPRCVKLIAHLKAARWNKNRTDYERTTAHGHYDLLAAAVYLWRLVDGNRHMNPNAPEIPLGAIGLEVMDKLPWQKPSQTYGDEAAMRALLGVDSNGRAPRPGMMKISRGSR